MRVRTQRHCGGFVVWLAGWVLLGVCSSATPLQAERVAAGDPFAVPAGLRTQVEFWKRIFGEYSSRQVVIHDTLHLDRVYSVIDLRDLAEEGLSAVQSEVYQRELVAEEKERVRALLVRLHQVGAEADDLTPEARRIAQLFGTDAEPGEFLAAAAEDRVRAQAGLGERFAAGIEISRRYLPEMEATFRRAGLPVELTRLPFVESCFNVRAYSKAGAAGIWQFMPATARLYMRVDDVVDERRDPMVATRAAARHLRRDYEALGAWPLAVTAYNHGRAGMIRAHREHSRRVPDIHIMASRVAPVCPKTKKSVSLNQRFINEKSSISNLGALKLATSLSVATPGMTIFISSPLFIYSIPQFSRYRGWPFSSFPMSTSLGQTAPVSHRSIPRSSRALASR